MDGLRDARLVMSNMTESPTFPRTRSRRSPIIATADRYDVIWPRPERPASVSGL